MSRTIAAGLARAQFPHILDDAENGETTLIVRHSKPVGFMGPAEDYEAFRLFRRIMREVGETLEISRDPDIIAAVERAQERINHGEIVWHED